MEEITFAFQPNRQYSTSNVKYGDIMTAITEFSKDKNVYNVFRVSGKKYFRTTRDVSIQIGIGSAGIFDIECTYPRKMHVHLAFDGPNDLCNPCASITIDTIDSKGNKITNYIMRRRDDRVYDTFGVIKRPILKIFIDFVYSVIPSSMFGRYLQWKKLNGLLYYMRLESIFYAAMHQLGDSKSVVYNGVRIERQFSSDTSAILLLRKSDSPYKVTLSAKYGRSWCVILDVSRVYHNSDRTTTTLHQFVVSSHRVGLVQKLPMSGTCESIVRNLYDTFSLVIAELTKQGFDIAPGGSHHPMAVPRFT